MKYKRGDVVALDFMNGKVYFATCVYHAGYTLCDPGTLHSIGHFNNEHIRHVGTSIL